jgi:hypothetical protein
LNFFDKSSNQRGVVLPSRGSGEKPTLEKAKCMPFSRLYKSRGATSPAGHRRERLYDSEKRQAHGSLLPAPDQRALQLDPIQAANMELAYTQGYRKFQNVSPERAGSPEAPARMSAARSRDLCRLFLRKTREMDLDRNPSEKAFTTLPLPRQDSAESRISASKMKFLEQDGSSLKDPGDRLIC